MNICKVKLLVVAKEGMACPSGGVMKGIVVGGGGRGVWQGAC